MSPRRRRAAPALDAHAYREVLQAELDEPVLAGGLFRRAGAWDDLALGPFSGLAALVARGLSTRRVRGLPREFLLAVTPTRVHAFGCSTSDGRVYAKEEWTAWERSALRVKAEETAGVTRVVIEPGATRRRLVCTTGTDEGSQGVVYAMQEIVGTPAAA